jgi:hypothetical protein
MATTRVMIELEPTAELEAMAAVPEEAEAAKMPELPGVAYGEGFAPVALPSTEERPQKKGDAYDTGALFDLVPEPSQSTYIVRAEMDEDRIDAVRGEAGVGGVYSDPVIEPCLICPGSPSQGTDADVERLLCAAGMDRIGMDGTGILVAIVDTGINMAYLNSRGKHPSFDAARSWVPHSGLTPGALPVSHGTMCAYDACIAAPECTLLDIALLRSTATGPTAMSGVLSDGVRAYRHLIDVMLAPRRPGEARSLVVNNSWGMFHPSWDFPVGDPGNYSDNPDHPFNRIVGRLERAGADILFAAGNCGADCPDGRCRGETTNAIYGANGHPDVLCVAGVDTTKTRVGYSTIGPGRLSRRKPDLAGYTHFRGSGVYPADGGTSAATPVTTGVVAAVRSKRPYDPGSTATHPAAIRSLMTSTAEDLGAAGYDFKHGYGVVGGCALYRRFRSPIDLCRRYPWLCEPHRPPIDLCRRYPWLCRKPVPPIPPIPPIPPKRPPVPLAGAEADSGGEAALGFDIAEASTLEDVGELAEALGLEGEFDQVELSYVLGWMHALGTGEGQTQSQGGRRGATGAEAAGSGDEGGCGCGG